MEVKKGYKKTDIGIIPEDWDNEKIENSTTKVGSGITPTGGMKIYQNEGRPFVRSQNVGWGNLNLDDIVYISDKIHNAFNSTELKTNDILLNISGASIGRCSVANQSLIGGNVNQHVCIIRTVKDKLNPNFLKYIILSPIGQKQIDRFQAGGNREGLNFRHVRSILFPLPKRAEQETIVEALSDVDSLITSLDKLIIKKQNIKKGTMQFLLTGEKRLPGFTGEWKEKRLGEIGECIRGVSYSGDIDLSSYDTDKTVRLLRSNNIQNNSINLDELQYVYQNKVKSIQYIKKNDIIICMANGSKQLVGKSAIFTKKDSFSYTFGAFMGCFRLNTSKAHPIFISNAFHISKFRAYIDILLSGSSINNLKPDDIHIIKIFYPKYKEQQAIAQVLNNMDFEIETLIKQRDKYIDIKQGMMQELLTGKTRLI